jgi:hypothetical protein
MSFEKKNEQNREAIAGTWARAIIVRAYRKVANSPEVKRKMAKAGITDAEQELLLECAIKRANA